MIAVAAAVLIALTWAVTLRSIRAHRAAVARRESLHAVAEARRLAIDLRGHLRDVDATLRFFERDWQRSGGTVNLANWRQQAELLPHGASLLLVGADGIVQQSDPPGAAAGDFGKAAFVSQFRSGLARGLFVGRPRRADPASLSSGMARPATGGATATGTGRQGKRWVVDFARSLRAPDGGFSGVIDLVEPVAALVQAIDAGDAASRAAVLLVGTADGRVLGALGVPGMGPGASLSDTRLREAIRAASNGTLLAHASDRDLLRTFAFQRLPGRNLTVLVGLDSGTATTGARRWTQGAFAFAVAVTGLVLLLALVLLVEVRAARRNERRLARERAALAAANAALAGAKAEADEKSAQFEAILTWMPDGVMLVDSGLRLVAWNQQCASIAGVPAAALRPGASMEDLLRGQAAAGEFGPCDVEAEVARRMAILRAGGGIGLMERARPGGRYIELRRCQLPDGGFVTSFTDTTARKQAEIAANAARIEAEAAVQSRARFVAMVSHEVRTPLAALLNGLDLLAEGTLNAAQRPLLDAARRSGAALAALLDDVLDISRMEAGRLTLRPSAFELRPLLADSLEIVGPQAAPRGVTLRLSIAEDVPEMLRADPGRLRQILMNLLSNAARYAAPGEVELRADMRQEHGGMQLHIAVTDQGPEIPRELRARLFQPFAQLPQPGHEPVGTGLGLSICRSLTLLMGGEIGCTRTPAGGNMFWLTLPIAAVAPAPASVASPGDAAAPRHLPRLRILLVEDVPANRLVEAMLLRREGHLVDCAANGGAALQRVARVPYDVVLLDLQLSDINGRDVVGRIHALPGPAARLPVVVVTAEPTETERGACLAAGAIDMLGKPILRSDLRETLSRVIRPRAPASADPSRPSPEAGDRAVVSEARIAELQENLSPATLARVAEECIGQLTALMQSLQYALTRQDATAIGEVAHAMAGLAGGYGLGALERRVRAVSDAARTEGAQEAAALARGLEAEVARATQALRDALLIEVA